MGAVTVLGLIAGGTTTFAFVPQAWKTIRTRETRDISLPTFVLMNVGVLLWIVYGFLAKDIPIIAANVVGIVPNAIILVMKIRNG